LQRRRSQVRRAQEAFRRRKEAATKSLEQRVVLLEECIEQISNQFIEFTDSLCRSQAIRQDPQLLRHSVLATSRILNLAQQVNPINKGGDGLGGNYDVTLNVPIGAISEISSSNDHAASGVGTTKASRISAEYFEFGSGLGSHHTQYAYIIVHSKFLVNVISDRKC
jgi:hypothetical protein